MRIPSSFPLFGQTVKVSIIAIAEWPHGEEFCGYWNPHTNTIDIRDDLDQQGRESTYCHELMHAMLDGISNHLSTDEVFVDQMGRLMHQAFFRCKHSRKRKESP